MLRQRLRQALVRAGAEPARGISTVPASRTLPSSPSFQRAPDSRVSLPWLAARTPWSTAGNSVGERLNHSHGAQHARSLATLGSPADDPPVAEDGELKAKDKQNLRWLQGAGTVVCVAGISYGAWWAIKTTMSLVGAVYAKPHIIAYVGFWFGFATASACAALAIGVHRLTFIRPESAFRDSFHIVRNHPKVQAVLGSTIRDTRLRTYQMSGGRLSFPSVLPKWVPHKVQILYKVTGEKGGGIVTAVCEKHPSLLPRRLHTNLLAVDVFDNEKVRKLETLVLIGDATQLEATDNIHKLVDDNPMRDG